MKQHIHIPHIIHTKLEKIGVAAIYLFGSYADGTQQPTSDMDIAVLLMKESNTVSDDDYSARFQTLYDLLDPLVAAKDIQIDLVILHRVSLELQAHVVRRGILLYQSNPEYVSDYEEHVMLEAADFLFLKNHIDQTILSRI